MKVTFDFKGSIFNQKENIILDLADQTTILSGLQLVAEKYPHLKPLLLSEGLPRSDILVIIDQIDVIAMDLLEMELEEGQVVTILPLAHGGNQ